MNYIFRAYIKLVSVEKKIEFKTIILVGALDIKSSIRRIEKKYGDDHLVKVITIEELPFDDNIILNIL